MKRQTSKAKPKDYLATIDDSVLVKAILMGDVAVGKTTLRRSYMGQSTDESYLPTLGMDLSSKTITTGEKTKPINFQVWDIAGHKSFERIRSAFFSGASGGFAVFDITRRESLRGLQMWIIDFWTHNLVRNSEKIRKLPFIIIANKTDMRGKDPQALSQEECRAEIHALEKALEVEIGSTPYIETCALTGENVDQAFYMLLERIVQFFNIPAQALLKT